ncbi:MAG: carbonic anhydrase [Marinicellaceae bacterium]
MPNIIKLFNQNKQWAHDIKAQNPNFFKDLSKQQDPEFLWIGCSDSRVPANQIINLAPGEVFVHRNIANVVVHTDFNCLSVIQYAVEILKVKHIIVCGHYGCGGIEAALHNSINGYKTKEVSLINNWLSHIEDVKRFHQEKFENLSKNQQANLLCELNVIEQVKNVCNTSIVNKAWNTGSELSVHGWIYDLKNGLINELTKRIVSNKTEDK